MAVGTGRCPSRTHQQGDRSHARAMLVEAAWAAAKSAWTSARLLRALRARPIIAAVAMARRLTVLCLAFVEQGRGLSLGASGAAGRQQYAARDGTAGPASQTEGQPAGPTSDVKALRDQEMLVAAPGQAKLRALRRAMETTTPEGTGARAPQIGRTQIRLPGDACSRRAALRHEVARARQQ